MSDHVVPHFHNDAGVSVIEIGSTLYRYAADLAAGEARPPECVVKDKAA